MKHFLKFNDLVRSGALVSTHNTIIPVPKVLSDVLKDVHCFVIHPLNLTANNLIQSIAQQTAFKTDEEYQAYTKDFTQPFEVCFFEGFGKPLYQMENLVLIEERGGFGETQVKALGNVWGFLSVYETGRDSFLQMALVEYVYLDTKNTRWGLCAFTEKGDPANGNIWNACLCSLNFCKTGLEKTKTRFKTGSGATKATHFIREIIHVKPKNQIGQGTGDCTIDWTHRFEVMGHWRTITGLGKDRNGQYCVENKTWVTEHIRGPESLPLVKKTRVVHPGKISDVF